MEMVHLVNHEKWIFSDKFIMKMVLFTQKTDGLTI